MLGLFQAFNACSYLAIASVYFSSSRSALPSWNSCSARSCAASETPLDHGVACLLSACLLSACFLSAWAAGAVMAPTTENHTAMATPSLTSPTVAFAIDQMGADRI